MQPRSSCCHHPYSDKPKWWRLPSAIEALTFVLAGVVKFGGTYLPPLCDTGIDAIGCLSAIADPQAMHVMLSALFAYVLHAAKKQQES